MRRLIHWAVRLYPRVWRNRYESEVDALVDDIEPSWRDLCGVLGRALAMRACALNRWRSTVVLSAVAHAVFLSSILLLSRLYVTPLPLHGRSFAPLPPPAPSRPTDITDPRVFISKDGPYSSAYSSLPLSPSGSRVVEGVGIYFPPLPDIGMMDQRRDPIRRVWPGQALESNIVRRVIPQYPRDASAPGAVSVFVEYLIGTDGSVKVLRTIGPAAFVRSARLAVEGWEYRPVRFRNQVIEVVSRIEVKFDADLAHALR